MPPQDGLSVQDFIKREAKAAGLPEALALAVADQESSFNPAAMGPEITVDGQKTHAVGTFQLLPSTAARFQADPNDPVQNVRTGVRYLKELFDRHGGDPNKILTEYGGVVRNTDYVPGVMAKVMRYQHELGGDTPNPNAGPPLTPAHGTTPTEDEEFSKFSPTIQRWLRTRGEDKDVGLLHKFGLDPTEAGDRPNLGGTIGGIGGALLGARGGPQGMRAGAVIGRYAGSSIGGAAGQLYNEYFGPPPAPDAYDTPTKRVLAAGGGQAAMEAGGDLVMGPLKTGVKSLLQEGISASAKQAFDKTRRGLATGFDAEIDALKTRIRAERLGLQQQAAAVRESAQQTLDAVRARTQSAFHGVTRSGVADIRAARTAGQTGIERAAAIGQGARDVAQSQYLAGQPARVSPLAAGRAV
ncbi:MAG TPA: transglycosylase SLT domain-containing protein, partial [Candidatus Limnocylindria bacterium]|nr:transglycosylase SLT domain-containing protein [Candidatus Limnocylindria bacterium]